MNKNETDQLENSEQVKEAQNALSSLKNLKMEPSPFMKTRVLANVREQRQKKLSSNPLRWLWPVLTVSLAVALIFVSINRFNTNQYQVGQPYMVRFDLRSLSAKDIAYAEIVVGQNVKFSSKKFAHVSEIEKLTLDWEGLVGKQYLPVVIEGVSVGHSQVVVYFYNQAGKVVDKKHMELQFSKS